MRRPTCSAAVRKTNRPRSRVDKERRSIVKLELYRARLQRCATYMKNFLRRSKTQLKIQHAYIQSARRIHSMCHRIEHFFRSIAEKIVANGKSPCWAMISNEAVNQAIKLTNSAKIITCEAAHNVQKIRGSVEQLARVEKEFHKALRHLKSAFRNKHFYVWRMQQVQQLRTAYRDCIRRMQASTEKMETEAETFYRRLTAQWGKNNIECLVPGLASWLEDS